MGFGPLFHLEERWHGHVHVAAFDEGRQVIVKEGQQQRCDVGSIHVGIGHNDHLVVTQLGNIDLLARPGAKSNDDVLDFFALVHVGQLGPVGVQNFAAQGQNGLGGPVAGLLCRTTGGVALYQEKFALGRLARLAVGQLAGQGHVAGEFLFLRHEVTRTAGGFACLGGTHPTVEPILGGLGVFLEHLGQKFIDNRLHGTLNFAVAQLVLGLAFKLGVAHAHKHGSSQTFLHILAGQGVFENLVVRAVLVDGAKQGRLEARFVRATTGRVDVVGEGHHLGLFAFEHAGSHANVDFALGSFDGLLHENGLDHGGSELGRVQVKNTNEGVREKAHFLVFWFGFVAFVPNDEFQTRVQVGHQLQTLVDDGQIEGIEDFLGVAFLAVFVVDGIAENGLVGPKANHGAVALLGLDLTELFNGLAAIDEVLAPQETALDNAHLETAGQRVHNRCTHAVQAAGGLVGATVLVVVKFTTGMQLGHGHRGGGNAFFRVNTGRDTPSVVLHHERAIGVERHFDAVAKTSDGFVHRVVDDFPDAVVQTLDAGVPDVHAGTLAYGFEAFEFLDHGRAVIGVSGGILAQFGRFRGGCCHKMYSNG